MLICFLGHAIIIILSVFITDEYFIPKKNSSHDQDVSGQLLKPQNAPTNSTSESTTTTMVEVISENNTCTPNKNGWILYIPGGEGSLEGGVSID